MGATYISMSATSYVVHTVLAIAAGAAIGATASYFMKDNRVKVDNDLALKNSFKKELVKG